MLGKLSSYSTVLLLFVSIIAAPNIQAKFSNNAYLNKNFEKFDLFKADRSEPVIDTQKKSYFPSETVEIEGIEFEAYERISLTAARVNKYSEPENLLLKQWDAYADGKGRILTSWALEGDVPDASDYVIEATGTTSGKLTKTWISTTMLTGESIFQLQQCANGSGLPQGQTCPESGSTGWVSGNVGASKSQYIEGDSISYRVILDSLDVGDVYEYTFGWDVTKGGLNAIDYLTTYNRSISNANPCKGTTEAQVNFHCTKATPTSTIAIPVDPIVTNGVNQLPGDSDDVNQIPGILTMWGGEMNEGIANCTADVGQACGLSAYNYTSPGTFPAGDESASITVTFKATNTKMVLAWGGHIATRSDWGRPQGSVNITGSPYHMFNMSGNNLTEGTTNIFNGNREVQLSTASIIAVGRIIIYKHAAPATTATFNFSGNFSAASYISGTLVPLQDNVADLAHSPGGANPHVPASSGDDPSWVINGISDFTNTLTVSETVSPSYSPSGIACAVTEDFGTANDTTFPSGSTAGAGVSSMGINLGDGDEVTCTFFNSFVTAAGLSINGQVLSSKRRPVARALVTVTDSFGNIRMVQANQFGYFRFSDLEAGSSLFLNVRHKGFRFNPQVITLNDNLDSLEVVAN
jgi:hypothetical protein